MQKARNEFTQERCVKRKKEAREQSSSDIMQYVPGAGAWNAGHFGPAPGQVVTVRIKWQKALMELSVPTRPQANIQ